MDHAKHQTPGAVDEDARRCIADLCSVLEVILKLLQEIGPNAAAIGPTLQERNPDLAANYVRQVEAVSQLQGFRALQDGLSLVDRVKHQYGL